MICWFFILSVPPPLNNNSPSRNYTWAVDYCDFKQITAIISSVVNLCNLRFLISVIKGGTIVTPYK